MVLGLGLITLQEASFWKEVNISDDVIALVMLYLKALF